MDKRVEAIARQLVREIDPAYHYGEQKDFIEDIHYGGFMEKAARLLAASDAVAWQPIETAPRDDTVLVYSKNKGYMMIAYKGKYSDEWYDDCGEELGIDDGELTHWQPLPAPPSDATP